MIQLPLHRWPVNLKPAVCRCFATAHAAYMTLRRIKGAYHRFWLSRERWSAFMQSMSYDTDWLNQTLRRSRLPGHRDQLLSTEPGWR